MLLQQIGARANPGTQIHTDREAALPVMPLRGPALPRCGCAPQAATLYRARPGRPRQSVRDDGAVTHEPDWFKLGGWSPRYARVAVSLVCGNYALGLIEANGDGREVGLNLLMRRNDVWVIDAEQDDIGGEGAGREREYVWACGPDVPGTVVTVEYNGSAHDVVVSERGWWGYVQSDAGEPRDTVPLPHRVA